MRQRFRSHLTFANVCSLAALFVALAALAIAAPASLADTGSVYASVRSSVSPSNWVTNPTEGLETASFPASVHKTKERHTIRNGRIVFQRYVGNVQQLFTIKPNGTGLRQVTNGTQTSENPNWSADGSKIIFDRTAIPTGNALGSLFAINANGGTETPLTASLAAAHRFSETPAWSPNGRRIAFRLYTISPYSDGIWIMKPDGSKLRQLTRGPGLAAAGPNDCACDADPRFSPDGRRIVFDREPNAKQAAVFVVNLDGSHLRRLTPWHLDAGLPKWSPDGSRILYSTFLDPHPGRSSNLFTIRPSGTGVRRLTHNRNGNGNSSNPAWSPNGKLIVFTHNRHAKATHSRNDLYVMPARGGRAKRLTHLGRFDANKADWGTAR